MTNRAVPLIVCLLAALPFSALAATAYVTDELEITLRRGQGTQFGIRAMLDSGSRVEVLQQDAESGYTQVRTSSGTEGWVLSRYLQNNPVARERVDTARQAQSQAEQQAAEAVAQLETVQSENAQMRTQIGQLANAGARARSTGNGTAQRAVAARQLDYRCGHRVHRPGPRPGRTTPAAPQVRLGRSGLISSLHGAAGRCAITTCRPSLANLTNP